MKKHSAIAILCSGIFSAAHGQEMKTSPAFDNIHNDQEIMQHIRPPGNEPYALINAQGSTELYYPKPVVLLHKVEIIDMSTQKINVYPASNLYPKLPHYPLTTPYDHFIPAKIIY